MSVQREKKAPVNRSMKTDVKDFSLGLNTVISGSLLGKGEAQVAENISFEQKGTIVPRRGRIKRFANNFSSSPTTGLGMLYKQDGTSRLVMSSRDSLYFDKPVESVKWQSAEDFNNGTMRFNTRTDSVTGNLIVENGTISNVVTEAGMEAFGVSGFTYGYRFTVTRGCKVCRLILRPALGNRMYRVRVWQAWLDPGETVNRAVAFWSRMTNAADVDRDVVEHLRGDEFNLQEGREYVVGVTIDAANAIYSYSTGTLNPTFFSGRSSVLLSSEGFPITAHTSYQTISVKLGIEPNTWEDNFTNAAKYNTGTHDNTEVGTLGTTVQLKFPQPDVVVAHNPANAAVMTNVVLINGGIQLPEITWLSLGDVTWNNL